MVAILLSIVKLPSSLAGELLVSTFFFYASFVLEFMFHLSSSRFGFTHITVLLCLFLIIKKLM
jgi:hypothetical protein